MIYVILSAFTNKTSSKPKARHELGLRYLLDEQ